eukprot:CAMPEP_0182423784 /NCGR_PEP_ID=MMETSP1167-20130531/9865_1 /TAXON_ID=2988 /ORGANISM="Mallomonas Sp, Strain CCMP3275" /LENGTH=496 /DNA_ID=CAMNT_0024603059 /DNA_START=284 /DNA_END=1774 /DNA_ORIENTATION=+
MYYDPTGGEYFQDSLDWRKTWKSIEKRGDFIFSQESNTQNEIRALIKILNDPFSVYKPPEEFIQESKTKTNHDLKRVNKLPQLANMGIDVRAVPSEKGKNSFVGVEVSAVYPDSSAERAGLRVGDLLVEVGKHQLRDINTVPSKSSLFTSFSPTLSGVTSFVRMLTYSSSVSAAMLSTDMSAEDRVLQRSAAEVYEDHVRRLLKGETDSKIRLGFMPRSSRFSFLYSNRPTGLTEDPSSEMRENEGSEWGRREYSNKVYHVTLKRDHLDTPALETPITVKQINHPLLAKGNKIAYIRMKSFSASSTKSLLAALETSPALEDASLVLFDLRNNFGGVLQEALFDASLFLRDPYTVLCYTVTPRGISTRDVMEWTMDPRSPTGIVDSRLPVGVLVNEGTASAAELFSSALRDNGRAVIIGTRTFGKGLIQHLFPLPDGGVMKLTIGEYLTPKKNHIVRNQGGGELAAGGLAPDIWCSDQPHESAENDQCVRLAVDSLL